MNVEQVYKLYRTSSSGTLRLCVIMVLIYGYLEREYFKVLKFPGNNCFLK